MNPIELLQKELDELKRALDRSFALVHNDSITQELHKTHFKNLFPRIKEYEKAIEKLKA